MDFTKIIKSIVEPRLAYFGFKYEASSQDLILGNYGFRRTYWCKDQYFCIGRVQYDEEQIINLLDGEDAPVLVPIEHVLFEDPSYRMWLSTRYIEAVLNNHQIIKGRSLLDNTRKILPCSVGPRWFQEQNRSSSWWEFQSEQELREVVSEIVENVLSEGLELLEREVADIRRHHEKLDQRRIAERQKRSSAS
jgi:hypothetical protein